MDLDNFEEIFNSECSCWIFVSKLHSILFGINENHTFKMKQHFGFPFKQVWQFYKWNLIKQPTTLDVMYKIHNI